MALPGHKTKIICTIGPASDSQDVLERLIQAGMDIARINFSHGDFQSHAKTIQHIRAASKSTGKRVGILADLPGPKMRVGKLRSEPVELRSGETLTLTPEEVPGDRNRVSVSFAHLARAVKPGDLLYLNDGFIQLQAKRVRGREVECRILVGGELRSRKGLNLPGIDLGMRAFTDHDQACLAFALGQGVDAVSQSFVESAEDVLAVRAAAEAMGHHPFIIAKIERSRALDHIDGILDASDGIMIARGDLGVEIPIEQIAFVQKGLMKKANGLGKPVITATQMLESMTANRRPTRAEATDVANAILDGTDCVMLSEESATGRYPVESAAMMAKIAAAIEPHRGLSPAKEALMRAERSRGIGITDLIALSVESTLERIVPAAVFVPTRSGATARSIARFRLPVWIVAVSSHEETCQRLLFSYGVHAVYEPEHPEQWSSYIKTWLGKHGVKGDLAILTEGPSTRHPDANHRMEIIDLCKTRSA